MKKAELPEFGADDALYLFDLYCWVYRFFHTIGGRCAHGVIEFVGKILQERDPRHFIVCRDLPFPTFRSQLSPKNHENGTGYKAHRTAPDATLLERLRWTHEMLEDVYGIPVYGKRGFEADDLIAALATQAKEAGMRVVIVAHDKDLMQLVDERCIMWDGKRVIGPDDVEQKFNVRASQLRDYLAICGDGADNIPGIKGAGPQAATEILKEFQTLDYALEVALSSHGHPFFLRKPRYRELLRQQHEAARLSQKLVTLAHDAPIKLDANEVRRA